MLYTVPFQVAGQQPSLLCLHDFVILVMCKRNANAVLLQRYCRCLDIRLVRCMSVVTRDYEVTPSARQDAGMVGVVRSRGQRVVCGMVKRRAKRPSQIDYSRSVTHRWKSVGETQIERTGSEESAQTRVIAFVASGQPLLWDLRSGKSR